LLKVEWTSKAIEDLHKLDNLIALRIIRKITWFADNFEKIIPEPLAGGLKPEKLGPALARPVTFTMHEPAYSAGNLRGMAVFVDHFGNCNTNIPRSMIESAGLKVGDNLTVLTPAGEAAVKFGTTYADVPTGRAVAFIDELNTLKLSVNMGSFSKSYETRAGSKIEVRKNTE